ncbi:hypothetical protein [Ferribacterium limneticum]|uniref:hypothetical protein n=1 Tax=Ferribacterium limneticum TaxID=76259 RepID=UPI001CF9A2DF|nr:hypothetical protein [Ferribacterium limneticum]
MTPQTSTDSHHPLPTDHQAATRRVALKDKHLKQPVRKGDTRIEAIQFNFSTQPGNRTRLAYRLAINEYMGVGSPQLMVEHLEATK